MKSFSTLVVVRAPPEALFASMRDRLPDIVPALDEIASIEELERSVVGGDVDIVNHWRARQQVPGFLRERLGASEIGWLDRARWSSDTLVCRWRIEPSIGDGAISCTGTTRFQPAMGGRGTRALFEGELLIDPLFISAIVGVINKPVLALVESVATTIIPTNFRAAAEAIAKRGDF